MNIFKSPTELKFGLVLWDRVTNDLAEMTENNDFSYYYDNYYRYRQLFYVLFHDLLSWSIKFNFTKVPLDMEKADYKIDLYAQANFSIIQPSWVDYYVGENYSASPAYYYSDVRFLTAMPKRAEHDIWKGMPEAEKWVTIFSILAIIAASIVFYVNNRIEGIISTGRTDKSFFHYHFETMKTVLRQEFSEVPFLKGGMFFYLNWLFFSFLLSSAYLSVLKATFSSNAEKYIQTFDDLKKFPDCDVMCTSYFTSILMLGCVKKKILPFCDWIKIERLYHIGITNDYRMTYWEAEKYLPKLYNLKVAYFDDENKIFHHLQQMSEWNLKPDAERLFLSSETFHFVVQAIEYGKNLPTPIRELMNYRILGYHETALHSLEELKNRFLDDGKSVRIVTDYMNESKKQNVFVKIQLEHVLAIFVILLAGLAVSTLVFVLEYPVYRCCPLLRPSKSPKKRLGTRTSPQPD